MADVERSEGKTVACLLSELEGERTEIDNHLSGDEHESRIMDFYDMVASVQNLDMSDIKESQQTDRFSTHMREYLLNSALPSDEIETLAVMLSAPFYAIEQGILVRITKGKRLAPRPGEAGIAYGPPLKRVHVPPGVRARVIHAVHEELGHAGRDSTYRTINPRID
jgi:hypothetical protein